MFKKPLANLKSSTPLRSSDRRKLKQRVLAAYSLPAEDGDFLVPDGILTAKFTNHLDLQGVAYLSPLGDPLWISIGKGSDELIPTVYTLWKRPNILPFLCTPSPVIPILIGGADLMIPGVMFSSTQLSEGQIVAICQYEKKDGVEMISAPLAVSRMAVSSAQIQEDNQKGKAALTIHTWKDHLWDIGSKHDAPAPMPTDNLHTTGAQEGAVTESATPSEQCIEVAEAPIPETSILVYSKEEVSTLLRLSLLQAISTTLQALPVSSFPITLSTFYSTYILPSRPAFPTLLVPSNSEPSPQDITIKGSTYKSVTAFIKAAEKETLLTTKALPKHTELVVTGVSSGHPAVQGHNSFATIGALEAKAAKKAEREEALREKEALAQQELEIRELWKPHQTTVELFQVMKASPSQLYTIPEIRNIVNSYIVSKDLINPHDKAYINLDDTLRHCVQSKAPKTIKTSSKNKNNEKATVLDDPLESEFLKRDELFRRIIERMQNWYEVNGEVKKGLLLPIQISIKMRQGRKASTLTRGFEAFLIDAEEMADELRKTCAGATSVSPVTGKGPNAGMEVLVQGKQAQAVSDYLTGKGVPKRWIEATGQ